MKLDILIIVFSILVLYKSEVFNMLVSSLKNLKTSIIYCIALLIFTSLLNTENALVQNKMSLDSRYLII